MPKKKIDTNQENTSEPQDKGAREVIAEVARKEKKPEEKIVPTEQIVTFEIDKEEYASVITDLKEIVKIPDITPIPAAPEFIKGIFNLRGQIVIVIDLERRFHLKREHEIQPRHIIIAEVEDNVFGVIVDEVTGVMRVPQSTIKPVPSLITSKIKAEYLSGVVVLEEEQEEEKSEKKAKSRTVTRSGTGAGKEEVKSRLLLLLDLPKMLAEKELLEFGNHIRQTVEKTTK